MASQSHAASVLTEPAGSSTAQALTATVITKDTGVWDTASSGTDTGTFLNPGISAYVLFDTTNPWVIKSDGSGNWQVASSGTAVAELQTSGSYLVPTASGTANATLYPEGASGLLVPVLSTADRLHLVTSPTYVLTY